MRIEVSLDLSRFTAQSDAYVGKRLQPAQQDALDYLAASARKRLQESTQAYFSDPVAWTQQAFADRRVNVGADIAATLVYVLPSQARYLGIEVFGGVRPAGDYATTNRGPSSPGCDVALDGNGSMPRDAVEDAVRQGARWVRLGPGMPPALSLPGRDEVQRIAVIAEKVPYRLGSHSATSSGGPVVTSRLRPWPSTRPPAGRAGRLW